MQADLMLGGMKSDEIETLRVIDKEARARYAALPGFDSAAQSPPIAADRLASGETIVARRRGDAVGFVLLQPLDDRLYLANISVRPEAGGKGVGLALLDATLARARVAGLDAVTLATFRTPRWNGPWFRRHGFVTMPEAEIGPGLRAILDRHSQFLDMATRETLWRRLA